MAKIFYTVPGYRLIIAIGYKYKAHKVLSFIYTEESGSTKSIIVYLSNYPDLFSNFSIHFVALYPCYVCGLYLLMRLTPTKISDSLI